MRFVVLAKFPTPGQVKTRLCPPLSPEQAAGVHDASLRTTLLSMLSFAQTHKFARPCEVVLCYTPDDQELAFRDRYGALTAQDVSPDRISVRQPPVFHPQRGGDLGNRLVAVHEELGTDEPVLLFGADTPDLPHEHLAAATSLLAKHDVVLGPTDDGGYWCLGLRPGVNAAALLAEIPWSSGGEFEATRQRAEQCGLSLGIAPRWHDVDRIDDLQALWQRLGDTPLDRVLGHALLDGQHGVREHLEPATDRADS